MYLTPDEFKILSGIKERLSNSEIEKKYKIKMYTNDPRIASLCLKYGIKDEGKGFKYALFEKADLSKAEVVSKNEIPYFEYEDWSLIKKIKITKRDVLALFKYFIEVEDDDTKYELIANDDFFNMYSTLEIKDPTGKTTIIKEDVG